MTAPVMLFAALAAVAAVPALRPVPGSGPTLTVARADNRFYVNLQHPTQIFAGVVIGSLSSDLVPSPVGLPPLLSAPVILGGGVGYPDGGLTVSLRESLLPDGVEVYVQGVTVTEVVEATAVADVFR